MSIDLLYSSERIITNKYLVNVSVGKGISVINLECKVKFTSLNFFAIINVTLGTTLTVQLCRIYMLNFETCLFTEHREIFSKVEK